MKSKIVKLGLSLVPIAGLLSSGVANGQSCSTWASNIVARYQSSAPPSQGARIATNQSDGRYVTYAVPFQDPLVYALHPSEEIRIVGKHVVERACFSHALRIRMHHVAAVREIDDQIRTSSRLDAVCAVIVDSFIADASEIPTESNIEAQILEEAGR
jgi:hypothetical protein